MLTGVCLDGFSCILLFAGAAGITGPLFSALVLVLICLAVVSRLEIWVARIFEAIGTLPVSV